MQLAPLFSSRVIDIHLLDSNPPSTRIPNMYPDFGAQIVPASATRSQTLPSSQHNTSHVRGWYCAIPTERIVYMKHHVHKIILFLVTLSFLFTGCSASTIGLKMADQIKEHTSSSTDSLPPQDVTPSDPAKTDDNTSLPITFSVSHAGDGALGVSANQVRVIRHPQEEPRVKGFPVKWAFP